MTALTLHTAKSMLGLISGGAKMPRRGHTLSLDDEFYKLLKQDYRRTRANKAGNEADKYRISHHIEALLMPILKERVKE